MNKKPFGKKTNPAADRDAAKLAEIIIQRGGTEAPASDLPEISMSEVPAKTADQPANVEVEKANDLNLNLEAVKLTVPVNVRVPRKLTQFFLRMAANESIARMQRVTPSQIYVAAITEYAKKNGYKESDISDVTT